MLSLIPVYSGISKLILWFPYSFHILCNILFTVCFHTVLSMFPFLFYWSHFKVSTAPSSDSSLFRKKSAIGQLNVQVATAEDEKRTIHCISNLLLFPLKFSLKEVFLKSRHINWKMLVIKPIFLRELVDWRPTTLRKCTYLSIFKGFLSDL